MRGALLGVGSVLALASAVGLGLARPANAEDCVRVAPTVTMTSAATQAGYPGTTLTYTMDVTNNDSVGCLSSDFTFEPSSAPYGWVVSPTPDYPSTLEPQQTKNFSVSYTSAWDAYEGSYELTVNVTQYSNNPASPDYYYITPVYLTYILKAAPTQDTQAPTVSIFSPTNGAVVKRNSTVAISAFATDNVDVSLLYYKVDGLTVCSGTSTTSCDWHVPSSKGTHFISVVAYDAAGNVGMDAVSVTVK